MPRGVKRSPESVEQQLEKIKEKIKTYQSRIAGLNAKKKALTVSKEKAEINSLYQFVKDSGKSPSQLIEELNKGQGQG